MSDAAATRALWYIGAGQAEIRDERLEPLAAGAVRVRARHGSISRGTESLVAHGRVPPSEFERMRAPFMAGDFPFPVKYGYATVGVIEGGEEASRGRTVFTLHPHQNFFNIPASATVVLPDNLPPQRAVLAANMETALNAVWDAAPGPADRAEQRPYPHLVRGRRRERFLAEFGSSGRGIPDRLCHLVGPPDRHVTYPRIGL